MVKNSRHIHSEQLGKFLCNYMWFCPKKAQQEQNSQHQLMFLSDLIYVAALQIFSLKFFQLLQPMLYKNSHAGSNQKSFQPKHLARGDGQTLLLKAVCIVTVTFYKLLNKALNTHLDPRSMVAMKSLGLQVPQALSQILGLEPDSLYLLGVKASLFQVLCQSPLEPP